MAQHPKTIPNKRHVGLRVGEALYQRIIKESKLLKETQSETIRRIIFKYFRDKYDKDISLNPDNLHGNTYVDPSKRKTWQVE